MYQYIFHPRYIKLPKTVIERCFKMNASTKTWNHRVGDSTIAGLCTRVTYNGDGAEHVMITSNVENVQTLLSSAVNQLECPSSASMVGCQLVQAFISLDRLLYEQLSKRSWAILDNYPWKIFTQSLLNEESKDYFESVTNSPKFNILKSVVKQNYASFPDLDLVNVAISLLRLKIDPSDDTFVSLLQECRKRRETFDLATLCSYSELGSYMRRSGAIIKADAIQILQSQWNDVVITIDNVDHIIRLIRFVKMFMTNETLNQFQEKTVAAMIQLHKELSTTSIVEIFLAVIGLSPNDNRTPIATCFEILESRVEQMTPYQLYEIVLPLNLIKWDCHLSTSIAALDKKIIGRGLILLNSNNKLVTADVVNLFSVFDIYNYPQNTRSTFEKLIESIMDDLDVFLFKNLSFCKLVVQNHRISELYCERIHANLHNVTSSASRLLAIIGCMSKMKTRSRLVDDKLVEYLLLQIANGQLGTQPEHVSIVGRYLIKCLHIPQRRNSNHERAVTIFTEKIISILPAMTIKQMVNMCSGFETTTTKKLSSNNEEVDETYNAARYANIPNKDFLLVRILREILSRKRNFTCLAYLNTVVNTTVMKLNDALRGGLAGEIIELYEKQTLDNARLYDVTWTLQLFFRLRLWSIDVFERMTDAFLQLQKSPDERQEEGYMLNISRMIHVLAKLNYRPSKLELVTTVAVNELERLTKCGDVINELQIVASLASLDVFPEKFIKHVFSFDFLNKLEDAFVELRNAKKYRMPHYLEGLLTQLNRAVILQCPYLSVPWFCQVYVVEDNLKSSVVLRWERYIRDGLIDALGGTEFVKVGPIAASYGLFYDFECLLNENGRPLSYVQVDKQHLKNFIRVALILTKPKHYTLNGRRQTATLDTRITQLEILGFKVVTIPHFEVDSMQLSDRQSKNQYFKEKIRERRYIPYP